MGRGLPNHLQTEKMKALRILGGISTALFTYHFFATAQDYPQRAICLIMVALSVTLLTHKQK